MVQPPAAVVQPPAAVVQPPAAQTPLVSATATKHGTDEQARVAPLQREEAGAIALIALRVRVLHASIDCLVGVYRHTRATFQYTLCLQGASGSGQIANNTSASLPIGELMHWHANMACVR